MTGSTDVRDVVRLARETDPDIPVLYSSGYPQEMIQLDGRLATDIELLPKLYPPGRAGPTAARPAGPFTGRQGPARSRRGSDRRGLKDDPVT